MSNKEFPKKAEQCSIQYGQSNHYASGIFVNNKTAQKSRKVKKLFSSLTACNKEDWEKREREIKIKGGWRLEREKERE